MSGVFWDIRFDPVLIEKTVSLAAKRAPDAERRSFEEERDAVLQVEVVDVRESILRELDRRWFSRLGLDAGLRSALEQIPASPPWRRACHVFAQSPSLAESVERQNGDGGEASGLVLRLHPDTCFQPDRLLPLLRRGLDLPEAGDGG